jgi:O-acetylhomoserine (thiol)-lyase
MTTAYLYDSVEDAAQLFNLEKEGNIYTRIGNPTTRVFEKRITALEGGVDGVATASGMGAIFYAVTNLAVGGDNFLISTKLYGGTITLLTQTLARFGIEARYFEPTDPATLENQIDERSKGILFESIANPSLVVADIPAIVEVANRHQLITICDNTLATPYGLKPLQMGVDVVVHSASKYITGNGTAILGVVVEGKSAAGKLKGERYPHFNTPDPSYHGLVYTEKFPDTPFSARVRLALLRDFGAVPSPFNSWLGILGLEHLHLRWSRHSENGVKIAQFLQTHPLVSEVNYPTFSQLGQKLLKNGGGGILSFQLPDYQTATRFVSRLKLFKLVTNISDSRSLVTHPASTTHQQLSREELKRAGVPEGLIRLSVGLEHWEDLVADLEQALEGAK